MRPSRNPVKNGITWIAIIGSTIALTEPVRHPVKR